MLCYKTINASQNLDNVKEKQQNILLTLGTKHPTHFRQWR